MHYLYEKNVFHSHDMLKYVLRGNYLAVNEKQNKNFIL